MKNKLSLAARIYNLISSASSTPPLSEEERESAPKGITIRFSPEVRKFIEHQAENLQCSVQDVVNITMVSVMRATNEPQSSQLELMCARFRYLFDIHGIATADIPEILSDTQLRRSDLMHNESLVDALNDSVLQHISNIFNVNVEWLKGTSNQVISTGGYNRWYKNVGGVAFHIALYILNNESIRVLFVAQLSDNGTVAERMKHAEEADDNAENRFPIGVVIERTKAVNGKRVKIFDVLRDERWNYRRCRNHINYLIMFCENTHLRYCGLALSKTNFSNLFGGVVCPIEAIESKPNEAWYPKYSPLHYYGDPNADEAFMGEIHYCERAIKAPHTVKNLEKFRRGDLEEAFSE